jgi:ubiquinone/menaquinone biosynthesis C-methylase UbiE
LFGFSCQRLGDRALEYIKRQLPSSRESFDLVFMRSVFTQMPAPDLERYTEEIARVLAPDGRFPGTFFLLNDESIHLMETLNKRQFPFAHGVFRTTEPGVWRACLR